MKKQVFTICCGMAVLADSKTKLIEILNDLNKPCENLQIKINRKQILYTAEVKSRIAMGSGGIHCTIRKEIKT